MQAVLQALTDGATVVTARAAQARHLQQHFDREQRRNGKKAWRTPDILPWSAWLERMWEEAVIAGEPPADSQLLRGPHAEMIWRELAGDYAPDLNASAAAGLARRAWELARAWHISDEELAARATTEDARVFAEWSGAYRRRCTERGWIDVAMLPDQLLTTPRYGSDIRFFGFATETPQQRRVFERFGASLPPGGGQAAVPSGSDLRLRCRDQRHEFDLAAQWAADYRRQYPDAFIAVCSPVMRDDGPRTRRQLLHVLQPDWHRRSEERRAVTANAQQTLIDCGVVRSALLALRLPGGHLAYDELGELLRSPFLDGGREEAAARALLDVRLRDRDQIDIDLWTLDAQDELRNTPVLARQLDTAMQWSGKFTGRQSPGRWCTLIDGFLTKLGWCSDSGLANEAYYALQSWRRLLEQFAASGLVSGEIPFGIARQYLVRAAAEEPLRSPSRTDAVQLLSVTEAFALQFDALWVAGMSAANWPPAGVPNPLISPELQRERQMPAADPNLHQALHTEILNNVLRNSALVAMSWPQQSDEAEQLPHPAFAGRDAVPPDPVRSDAAKTRRTVQLATASTEQVTADIVPPMAADEASRGGSAIFRFQASCPARAFFELRLGARQMPVPSFGVDAKTRGVFVHKVLELLYSELESNERIAACSSKELEALIDRSLDRAAGSLLPARDALATMLATHEKIRLRKLIGLLLDIDRSRALFTTESIEGRDAVQLGPLQINLRHDRIDRLHAGGRLVFDYKTGRNFAVSEWLGERPVEPQLPLYAATMDVDGVAVILLNETGVEVRGVARPDYVFANVVDAQQRPFSADWESQVAEWRRALVVLAEEFAGGDCRINTRDTRMAAGEFAMLTRVGELL